MHACIAWNKICKIEKKIKEKKSVHKLLDNSLGLTEEPILTRLMFDKILQGLLKINIKLLESN